MNRKLKLEIILDIGTKIRDCEKNGHIQQVAFSTYHYAFTQVCFTCGIVRTDMEKGVLIEKPKKKRRLIRNERLYNL